VLVTYVRAYPRLEKRLSMLDPLALDTLRSKATALKNELESASRVKTSPGTIRRIEINIVGMEREVRRKDTGEEKGSGSGMEKKDAGNVNENGQYFFWMSYYFIHHYLPSVHRLTY
jgi:hypothetical protein